MFYIWMHKLNMHIECEYFWYAFQNTLDGKDCIPNSFLKYGFFFKHHFSMSMSYGSVYGVVPYFLCKNGAQMDVWCTALFSILDLVDRILGGVVVIAANAGGAWTPIGDVTTTMLWIHGQISTVETMKVFVFILTNLFHISDLLFLFYYYIVLLSLPRYLCLIHVDLLSNVIMEFGHHQSWYLSFSFFSPQKLWFCLGTQFMLPITMLNLEGWTVSL